MTTHEVLVAARNKLEQGWGQGPGFIGGPCAAGAIGECGGDATAELLRGTAVALRDAACLSQDEPLLVSIYDWNDHRDRTKEEVLAAFDKAIAATAPEPADPLSGDLSPSDTNPAPEVGHDLEGPQKPAYEPVEL